MTMNMQMLQQMRSFMDESSKKNTFTLQELKNDGMMYTSYFDDKSKAKAYARKFCDKSSSIYIFKTYCIKIYDPVDMPDKDEHCEYVEEDVDYSPEYDFSKGKKGAVVQQKGKTRITIYIDDDVIEEFRSRADKSGRGYQTIINQVLREYLNKSDKPIDENTLRRVIREELKIVEHTTAMA